jgi:hypothetical protein
MYKRSAQILLLLIPLLTSINNQSSLAQDPDPGIPDSVRVSSGTGTPGSQIILTVTGYNDEDLAGVLVPLKFPSSFLVADSISYLGSRLASASIKPFSIDTAANTLSFGAVYFGTPLDTGNGLLARIYFSVKPGALPETVSIDTINNPPSVLSFSDPGAKEWVPQFKPGKIIIQLFNPAPVWQKIANQSISEGDSLKILLKAKDPANDPLTFAALNGPPGSRVNKLSDSTALFTWVPDFVGPYSSSGSPFQVTLVVSDGDNFIRQDVAIFVINKNALPVITAPDSINSPALVNIHFQISASDQDQEPISISAFNLPPGANFDGQNPGSFDWTPAEAQVGAYNVIFEAVDASGGKNTDTVVIAVTQAQNYILSLPDIEGFSGETVTLPLSLVNKDSIGGFQLLLHYDPSVLALISVSRTGTRTENWESFNVVIDPQGNVGDIKIVGIANLPNQIYTPPLSPGQGPVVNLTFQISDNPIYAGFSVPIIFKLTNPLDNTLSDKNGNLIGQDLVTYKNGKILIKTFNVLLGDINLNGFAFDIGDAVRFANYFIDPVVHALNSQQTANSDVNQDGITASIADLVFLLRRIVEGPSLASESKPLAAAARQQAEISLQRDASETKVKVSSSSQIGGLCFVFEHQSEKELKPQLSNVLTDFDVWYKEDKGTFRLLIFSFQGRTLPSGEMELFDLNDPLVRLREVTAADAKGYLMEVRQSELPPMISSSLDLEQNYPNPFNQDTKIDFYMSNSASVKLEVFNVRGQKVRLLLDQVLSAGRHQINWDGKNESGESVATGVYLYRLVAGKESLTRKLTFIK